ncbi:hypothetical protein J2S74_000819 [Evansella vedderi]|uniref:Uncharacterized protein n=1 Tax=Evansella vedderi TaxID=38282 RepID=A0ABT9ZQC3_9BACI|nr:hypothetical protein [Evansella vedderi]
MATPAGKATAKDTAGALFSATSKHSGARALFSATSKHSGAGALFSCDEQTKWRRSTFFLRRANEVAQEHSFENTF